MRGKFILVVLLILQISCTNHKQLKTGTYVFVSLNRFEMAFRYVFQNVVGYNCSGRSLTINEDSTFVYMKVPYKIIGIWKKKNDYLILKQRTHFWINDSIKKVYQPYFRNKFNTGPIVFLIKEDYLIRLLPIQNHRWIIEKLKFNVP
jgi:hypothetical protein